MTEQGNSAEGPGGLGATASGASIATELDAAGVPQDAMRRLAELQPGRAGSIFTSDLSVNEFLLVREVGFRPLGLVLGSSIYHVGLQIGRWSRNQELDVLSQAMYHARELAMSRMEAEADALNADGIVGVRLDVEMKEFGADIAEFIAVGTAVKAEEGAGGGGVDWVIVGGESGPGARPSGGSSRSSRPTAPAARSSRSASRQPCSVRVQRSTYRP